MIYAIIAGVVAGSLACCFGLIKLIDWEGLDRYV